MEASANAPYLAFAGKRIVLGVCGGIAAYKSVLLLRLLVQAGAQVQVLMTEAAHEFVGAVTFSALSGRPVLTAFTEPKTGEWHNHVELGLWADALVIAPATASTLAKAATGQSDSLLLATYLSARCPVLWCPAMDLDMYVHGSVQANMAALRSYGDTVLEAASGALASGLQGQGRLPEPEVIFEEVRRLVHQKPEWKGKRVLITAGPTRERIDPVRYVGNFSSGKMGYALAHEAAALGAEVVLVSGASAESVHAAGIRKVSVESAEEMAEACRKEAADCQILIFCAAVADYRPAETSLTKTKKTGADWNIHLVENVDIAAEMGRLKKPGQISVGFALESGQGLEAASQKLARKNLDLICLNSLDEPEGSPLGADHNAYRLLSRSGQDLFLTRTSKAALAAQILHVVETLL